MNEILYELYIKCFPEYPISNTLFQILLRPELSHLIYVYNNKKTVGFSMIHGESISLLCVEQEHRNNGYGSFLLNESEKYISESGSKKILLGRGSYYLLQGVPDDSFEAVSFFKNKGYIASWTSMNMTLPLETFNPNSLDIPKKPDMVTFRFAGESDIVSLLDAVNDAEPSW